jgi:hypothetical protein
MSDPASDLPDTALFWRWVGKAVRAYIGWILVALGVLAIALGYWGVANQSIVAKQLPYVVSGGILGLGLVAVGAYYLVTEELRSDSGRLDRLEQMVLELHSVLLSRADVPEMAHHNGASTATLVALRDSQRYHRPDCRMVAGKSGLVAATAEVIAGRGLEPCGMCDPVLE